MISSTTKDKGHEAHEIIYSLTFVPFVVQL